MACWKGYEQKGFKKKNGRSVPNCVPKTSSMKKGGMTQSKKIALKKASTKNKNIKPVKAFTGLEIALMTGLGTMAASQILGGGEKQKMAMPYDPFKKYDPAMTPSQYVAKSTSASSVTGEALNPVTSEGESASRSMTTGTGTTANEQEEEKKTTMKKGGMVRGQGAAIRGTKFKGIF